ncbi:carcinoembryonic antigen-related cell adhesion molecule 16-like [Varanus komodoensis]|uniref:carcinoembryonic antigen-related cell adhesion molecule 16-like n=1 Tax=Varanus komodoensis TaxID=61221 RepID=UPI001CF77082|nr:carcinoembryonic antigen-related cell adhesion molecule 16-like [Varanus komodoensis]
MQRNRLAVLAALALAYSLVSVEGVSIALVPPHPHVGQTVTLSVKGIENPSICLWFRGHRSTKGQMIFKAVFGKMIEKGQNFNGRQSLGENCALVIQSLHDSDSGEYFLVALPGRHSDQKWRQALAWLRVSS